MADKQTQLNAFVRGAVRVQDAGAKKPQGKRTLTDGAVDAAGAEGDVEVDLEAEHAAEEAALVADRESTTGWVAPIDAKPAPAAAAPAPGASPWKKLR